LLFSELIRTQQEVQHYLVLHFSCGAFSVATSWQLSDRYGAGCVLTMSPAW